MTPRPPIFPLSPPPSHHPRLAVAALSATSLSLLLPPPAPPSLPHPRPQGAPQTFHFSLFTFHSLRAHA